ncbi:hypothetical protein WJX79_008825 [Trebouxia sp. C0005]
MGAALSHSLHHSRRPTQIQQCARLMSICGQQPQVSSTYMLASMHASTCYQHLFCTETASGISSDSVCKRQLQKEQRKELASYQSKRSWAFSDHPPKLSLLSPDGQPLSTPQHQRSPTQGATAHDESANTLPALVYTFSRLSRSTDRLW